MQVKDGQVLHAVSVLATRRPLVFGTMVMAAHEVPIGVHGVAAVEVVLQVTLEDVRPVVAQVAVVRCFMLVLGFAPMESVAVA